MASTTRLGLLLTAVAAILVLIDGSFAHAWGSLGSPSSALASPVGTATTTLGTISGDAFNQPTEAGLADTGQPGPDRPEAKGEVEGIAPSGAFSAPRALDDVVVIGKVDDLASTTLRPGERTLLDQLPNQGSPRLNYAQNSSVLRREMGRGVPIRDASVDPVTGALRNNTGFLRAERDILTYRGWTFDPKSGYWMPPR